MAASNQEIRFPGASGESLSARLDSPAGEPRAYALFAHCFTCSKETVAASRIAGALAELGIATLRFDFTGLGGSGGEFANTSFTSNVDDIAAAATYLAENYEAPAILIGHSLGGAAVLAAAERIASAAAVVTIGAPADPDHVAHLFADARPEIEARGEAEVQIAGRSFRIGKGFLDDIEGQAQEARVQALRKALLVMHAPGDRIVGIENASRIFVAAKHPKSFVSLDDADHLLSRRADAVYAAGIIAAWVQRYLGEPAPEHRWPTAKAGEVVVEETGRNAFQQAIAAGSHHLLADEPLSFGGGNTGPAPYDLLAAGLGACTAMTMRMYARRKKLPLEGVSVRLAYDKIHAEDCVECETRVGKIDRIRRHIRLDGPLDEAARAKLLMIADKCPVHRTLHSEVLVETELEG
ncbi:MAG: alpha/beta fold hydrolase [Alphaproteobacteria bacterium]|jgi:putative redox protein|nr:alpha/beta fold hydrolase [Alphaproteobacteria bacterium]